MKQQDIPGSTASPTSLLQQLSISSRSGNQWSKINPETQSNSFTQILPKNSPASTHSLYTSTPVALFMKLPLAILLNPMAWLNAFIERSSIWSDPCFNTPRFLPRSGTKPSTQPTRFTTAYRQSRFLTQSLRTKLGSAHLLQ